MTATKIVHWPGKDTAACDDHTEQLKTLAKVMGFVVSVTPLRESIPCANCKNESKAR
jgi:hypothetical protein